MNECDKKLSRPPGGAYRNVPNEYDAGCKVCAILQRHNFVGVAVNDENRIEMCLMNTMLAMHTDDSGRSPHVLLLSLPFASFLSGCTHLRRSITNEAICLSAFLASATFSRSEKGSVSTASAASFECDCASASVRSMPFERMT